MNAPEYRLEHGLTATPGEVIREAKTYTREQWDEMNDLRRMYYLFETFGVLRYIARFVRSETGMKEIAFYDQVRRDLIHKKDVWPITNIVFEVHEHQMAPPASWALFMDEIRRYLVDHLGISDDSALRTALTIQLVHIPAPGRRFPETLELEHDFAAWQETVLITREEGHRDDWEQHIPKLSEFGTTTLTIDDPNDICRTDVGKSRAILDLYLGTWELESPIARPRLSNVIAAA